jgi:hypothetical protein|tara:strand:+ start:941 stop:1096 length:156 start_codon:yes stop_codon:yes gene_type:complete
MDSIMNLNALSLFNNLTDEDFIAIHEAGQLKNLCHALSFDLNSKSNKDILN